MSDSISYFSVFDAMQDVLPFGSERSSDNYGNKAHGPTIVCASGDVVERTLEEFKSDIRAISAAGTGEGFFANPLNGYTIDLGNLPSPLQSRCRTALKSS